MTATVAEQQRLARLRAGSQGLQRPAAIRHPADVARVAGPIQAQEPRAARLAFRARSRRLSAADVDRARCDERSLLRAWMMRRTVHLIAAEDAGWLLPLYTESLTRQARKRMADFGLGRSGQDRALALLRKAIDVEGPLTRPELGERLERAGFDASQQIKVHLWVLATADGELCLGPDRGAQTCLVRTSEWLGELPRRPRDQSLAELARRYLRGYGPAIDRDFARWAGLSLGDARIGFETIAGELAEVQIAGEVLLVLGRRGGRAPRAPLVRLLGAFDNYNLGYQSRDFAVDPEDAPQILPGGGIVRPTIIVDGRFAGTWSSRRSGKQLVVELEPFAALEPEIERALAAEVADLGRFEGLAATPRQSAPLRSRAR